MKKREKVLLMSVAVDKEYRSIVVKSNDENEEKKGGMENVVLELIRAKVSLYFRLTQKLKQTADPSILFSIFTF